MLLKRTSVFPVSRFESSTSESNFEFSFLKHHPSSLVEEFAKTIAGNSDFELSYYKYLPQSLFDERRVVKIKARDLNTRSIEGLLSNLQHDEELAFHSSVSTGTRKKFHLPLIDFHGRLNAKSLDLMNTTLGTKLFEGLVLYDSGRSFHGYIMKPLSEKEWIRFMGTLLLMNLPDKAPISDSRWIGHRLRAGYSSLRWSRNTKHYTQSPVLADLERIKGA